MAAPVRSGVLQFSGSPAGGLHCSTHQPFHCCRASDERSGLVDKHEPAVGAAATSGAAAAVSGALPPPKTSPTALSDAYESTPAASGGREEVAPAGGSYPEPVARGALALAGVLSAAAAA